MPEEGLQSWKSLTLRLLPDHAGELSKQFNTGDWRSRRRPVTDRETCIKCGMCYILCPDMCYAPDPENGRLPLHLGQLLLQRLRHLYRGMPQRRHFLARRRTRGGQIWAGVWDLRFPWPAAEAVKLANVDVIAAYPITPADPHCGASVRAGGRRRAGRRIRARGKRAQRHERLHAVLPRPAPAPSPAPHPRAWP